MLILRLIEKESVQLDGGVGVQVVFNFLKHIAYSKHK